MALFNCAHFKMETSLKGKNLLPVTTEVQTITFEMSKKINEQNDQILVALLELCVAVGILCLFLTVPFVCRLRLWRFLVILDSLYEGIQSSTCVGLITWSSHADGVIIYFYHDIIYFIFYPKSLFLFL